MPYVRLQECMDVFKESAGSQELGFNLFLVLRGGRPGALLEVQECLQALAKVHGQPVSCRALQPAIKRFERNAERGVAPSNDELNAVARYFNALQVEYMHILLQRMRTLVKRHGCPVICEACGGEVYVLSSRVARKDVMTILSATFHEENDKTFSAIARAFGYPPIRLADRPIDESSAVVGTVDISILVRNVASQKQRTLYLYGVWCKSRAHKVFAKAQAARMHEVLAGQHFALKSGARFVVDTVIASEKA